jgi:hypothetical protein
MLRKSALRRHRCPQCIPGSGERHQEGISLGVNHLPVPFRECVTEHPTVLIEDFRISPVAESLNEFGRPLDVGEEECDRSGRERSHGS